MTTFFSLFSGAVSCVFYGFLITAFIIATLYFLLSTASKGIVRSIAFWLSMAALSILLLVNMSVMVGAFRVKSATSAMEVWLNQQLHNASGYADIESSQQIGDSLDENFPILEHYLNLFDFSGIPFKELPTVMADSIRSEMNSQIWSNVLWSLGFIIAAVLISLYFDKGEQYSGAGGRRSGGRNIRNSTTKHLNRPNDVTRSKPHFNRNRRHRL